ncbi:MULTISPECIES: ABC transporter substrate-binding protein [Aequorivita]|uniref:ABC transporter substrate-binding protein n=1 Tax=Aequorivita iocasae TaxID=2803865 RepID=A0ABX7DSW0_9FLAO|nr:MULTISPECIES: helical backbone metal receptor [Aequorivita]QQX76887.1 ABC transporter substrate-binding protein [Aequorivita iocasae]UCA56361.1 helical backbone metal receptor [Aequorivita sp. F7]
MEFVDQLNRTVTFTKTPTRIVSLVPSQTELLVDLGLQKNIIGITKFCVHPNDLREEKVIVGGTKQVNFEKIKSLKPDIIICNKEENTEEMVLQLESIAPVWVSDIATISESIQMIFQLGKVFEVAEKALEIVSNIKSKWENFKEYIKDFPPKKVLYLIWKKPYMAAGRRTFIDCLLTENNFENICTEVSSRYPKVKPEDFLKADLILLSTEPYPFNKGDVIALAAEFETEVKLVDGEFFSWYGSRLMYAFDYFKTLR